MIALCIGTPSGSDASVLERSAVRPYFYNGFAQPMKDETFSGTNSWGEIVEVGRSVGNLKVGDRVMVP